MSFMISPTICIIDHNDVSMGCYRCKLENWTPEEVERRKHAAELIWLNQQTIITINEFDE